MVCVAPSFNVRPQWNPAGSQESPWFHQPPVEFPHQFQPTRTSLFATQNAFQLAHCADATANVLQYCGLPLGPASIAISPMFTLTPFARAQVTSAVQVSRSTVG